MFCCINVYSRYNHINDDASLPSFTCITAPKFNPELLCEKGEGTRDRNHHVAPIMMLEKFGKLCGNHI